MILFYQVNKWGKSKTEFSWNILPVKSGHHSSGFPWLKQKDGKLIWSLIFRYYPNASLKRQVIVLSHRDDNTTW